MEAGGGTAIKLRAMNTANGKQIPVKRGLCLKMPFRNVFR